jgi:hypothetical protein
MSSFYLNRIISFHFIPLILLVKEEEMAAMSKKIRPTLDPATRLELRKLCWETMFGQELVKLTIMDLASLFSSLLDFSSHFIVLNIKRRCGARIFCCWKL